MLTPSLTDGCSVQLDLHNQYPEPDFSIDYGRYASGGSNTDSEGERRREGSSTPPATQGSTRRTPVSADIEMTDMQLEERNYVPPHPTSPEGSCVKRRLLVQ